MSVRHYGCFEDCFIIMSIIIHLENTLIEVSTYWKVEDTLLSLTFDNGFKV